MRWQMPSSEKYWQMPHPLEGGQMPPNSQGAGGGGWAQLELTDALPGGLCPR